MSCEIKGMPGGYEIVRIGWPTRGEVYLSHDKAVAIAGSTFNQGGNVYVIVKKTITVETGKKYVAKNGKVFGPLQPVQEGTEYPFIAHGKQWNAHGVRYIMGDRDTEDLVAEYVEPMPVYRAFAHAAEFAPHRDKWIKRVSGGGCFAVSAYSDMGIVYGADGKSKSYQELLSFKFEDGTTCGVLVTEGSAK